jgi:nitroimidazol reductase NimA-like FMN-containing flavoprotein (pyridoxamine 5'-phosphate oxidase superfamily)
MVMPTRGADMPNFTDAEKRFLDKNEIARLAAVSSNGMPHVVPVSYVFRNGVLLAAIDYETKKYRNILRNPQVALVVDAIRPNRGVLIQGRAEIFEKGVEFRSAYEIFHKKLSWVRADPWNEGEAPFIRIQPSTKASWGFR